MRTFIAAALVVLLTGSAFGQGLPPLGIPMGGDKPQKEVDPLKENAYNSAINKLPDRSKASDPWQGVRPETSAPPSKKKTEK